MSDIEHSMQLRAAALVEHWIAKAEHDHEAQRARLLNLEEIPYRNDDVREDIDRTERELEYLAARLETLRFISERVVE